MFQLDLGGGLELRLLHEADAEEVFRATERNRGYLREWLPWVDRTHSVEQPRQFIRESQAVYESGEGVTTGIFMEGAFVGAIGLHKVDKLNHSTSLGYWLDAQHQGRGIMTRACRAMITHGFVHHGLHRIEIRCATGNAKSCAIPERLGFAREGLLREAEWMGDGRYLDLIVWAMLAQDWKGE